MGRFFKLFLLILLLTLLGSSFLSLAQEITGTIEPPADTPAPIFTETGASTFEPSPITLTEVPVITSETPQVEETIPTETPMQTTEEITAEATVVIQPTAEQIGAILPLPLPPIDPVSLLLEPVLVAVLSETFDTDDLSLWDIGMRWELVPQEQGFALQVTDSIAPVISNVGLHADVAIELQVQTQTGTLHLHLRQSETERYTLAVSPAGEVAVYRSEALLESAIATPTALGEWRHIRFSVMDDILRVAIDGVEVIAMRDTSPLSGAGQVAFNAAFPEMADTMEQTLLVDNIWVWVPEGGISFGANLPIENTSLEVPEVILEVTNAEPAVYYSPVLDESRLDLRYTDTFEFGDPNGWILGSGWSLASTEDGQALRMVDSGDLAYFLLYPIYDMVVEARVLLNTGALQLHLRLNSSGSSYVVRVNADGVIELLRNGQLLETGFSSSAIPGTWRVVRASAFDNMIRVVVDDQEVFTVYDPLPLPGGSVAFSGSGMVGDTLWVDDFNLWTPVEMPSDGFGVNVQQQQNSITVSTVPELITALEQANTTNSSGNCSDTTTVTIILQSGIYTLDDAHNNVSGPNGLPIIICNVIITTNDANPAVIERNDSHTVPAP